MLKVTRYTRTLDYMAADFKPGDRAAIVFVDTGKLIADMGANHRYCVNDAKIATHRALLKRGYFEAPIILPRLRGLIWLEGFHQMVAAVDADLPIVPVTTTEPFVAETKRLVGTANAKQYKNIFDLSDCADMLIYY